jgi:chromate transporter
MREHATRVTPLDLFIAFTRITLISFGGVLFWCRRLIVVRNRWLSEQEFVEIVALSQLLPGVNGINLTVMIGHRFAGAMGAAAALAGFLGAPILVVTAIAMLHERYGEMPLVQSALTGMSAVAVGLLIATGAKVAEVLGRRWRPWLFVVLAFAGVGVMRWPLLAVLAALAPWAIAAAWKGKY